MAEVNDAILDTLARFMGGSVDLDEEQNHCLGFVTSVIQDACKIPIAEFYSTYVHDIADPKEHWTEDEPWARDAEKSLRNLGMGVPLASAKPGDLFFIWRDAEAHDWSQREGYPVYYGHVGILLTPHDIIENVDALFRQHSFSRGNIQITPRNYWFKPSDVIRFDPAAKPKGS